MLGIAKDEAAQPANAPQASGDASNFSASSIQTSQQEADCIMSDEFRRTFLLENLKEEANPPKTQSNLQSVYDLLTQEDTTTMRQAQTFIETFN